MKVSHTIPGRSALRAMPALFEDFDRLVDAWWPSARPYGRERQAFQPALDVHETADALVVTVDLPGVRTQDVEIVSERDVLTIRGERQAPEPAQRDARPARRWRERASGRFERRLRFPRTARLAEASARQGDGVLTITVPKTSDAGTAPRRVSIDVA